MIIESLERLCCKVIFENLNDYINIIENSLYKNLIWTYIDKFIEIDKMKKNKLKIYEILKKYCKNDKIENNIGKNIDILYDNETDKIIIKKVNNNGTQLKYINYICNKLGLLFIRKIIKIKYKKKKIIEIMKTNKTIKEVINENNKIMEHFYKEKEKKRLENMEYMRNIEQKLLDKSCCEICDKNIRIVNLYISVCSGDVLCENCIMNNIDNNGNNFSGYKFEPLYI